MTTPKIEELIARLHERAKFLGPELTLAILPEAAHAMQSQAERIAELELDIDVQAGSIEAVQAVNARQAERIAKLERESETNSKAYGLAIVERDALRAELGNLPEAQAEMLAEIKRLRAQLAAIPPAYTEFLG